MILDELSIPACKTVLVLFYLSDNFSSFYQYRKGQNNLTANNASPFGDRWRHLLAIPVTTTRTKDKLRPPENSPGGYTLPEVVCLT